MAEVKINLDNPLVQSLLTGDISGLEDLVGKILNAAPKRRQRNLSVQADMREPRTERLTGTDTAVNGSLRVLEGSR